MRVEAISRERVLKGDLIGDAARADHPFRILTTDIMPFPSQGPGAGLESGARKPGFQQFLHIPARQHPSPGSLWGNNGTGNRQVYLP